MLLVTLSRCIRNLLVQATQSPLSLPLWTRWQRNTVNLHSISDRFSMVWVVDVDPCVVQADQRFVWNGNLLRELAAQPEVSSDSLRAVDTF